MLKFTTTNISEIPAEYQKLYTENENGTFQLQVDGAPDVTEVSTLKAKIKEFRDSNIDLRKSNEALSSFEQIFGAGKVKPEEIQAKVLELATQKADSLVMEMKNNYEAKVKDLELGLTKKSSKLTELLLGDAVLKAGTRHGVVATAYDDVLRRAQSDFEVTDDGLKFKHEKLDAEGKAYDLDTWMLEQAKQAPHLFASSQGTGAARPVKAHNAKAPAASRLVAGLQQRANGNQAKRI